MDKFSNSFYNNYKERTENKNNGSALAHSFIDWKKKNRYSIKYAGDNALESMKKGFADAANFMKDAGKSTNLEDVENTAVKWQLANDANDEELYNAAQNEMIGHLSDENKEEYLKNAVPLSEYIEAKDTYDYNNGNYTTTKYLNTQPDEKVKQIQNQLNVMGYTDKFGNPLKEDGIAGSKTLYAFDKFDENTGSNNKNQSNQPYMKENVPLYSPEWESNNAKTISNSSYIPFIEKRKSEINIYKPGQTEEILLYGTGKEKSSSKQQIINYITKKANELGLPVRLALATAFTESSFVHFKSTNGGYIVNENNGDYGLMQINKNAHSQAFSDKKTYGDIINNWHDNVDYGLSYLKACYYEAANIFKYTGDDLLKATYSNYNSGSCSAYQNHNHQTYNNTINFWNCYSNKYWE